MIPKPPENDARQRTASVFGNTAGVNSFKDHKPPTSLFAECMVLRNRTTRVAGGTIVTECGWIGETFCAERVVPLECNTKKLWAGPSTGRGSLTGLNMTRLVCDVSISTTPC